MEHIKSFSIDLDNSAHQYSAGSAVTGTVHLRKTGEVKTTGIAVKIIGETKARFIERIWKNKYRIGGKFFMPRIFYEAYHAEGTVLEESILLLGDNDNENAIPSDDVKLPFSFTLPLDKSLPPNCDVSTETGALGQSYVISEYKIEAVVKNITAKSDLKCSVPIWILPSTLDLDLIPDADQPLENTIKQSFPSCCIFCPVALSITVSIPRKAVHAGDTVPVLATFDTAWDIQCSTAELIQIWNVVGVLEGGEKNNNKTNFKHRQIHSSVHKLDRDEEIPAGSKKEWRIKVRVPQSVPPTKTFDGSCITKLEYGIKIKAVLKEVLDADIRYDEKYTVVILILPLIVGSRRYEAQSRASFVSTGSEWGIRNF